MKEGYDMRHLILMGGVAGSGKSTYAKAYAEKHPNTHYRYR